MTKVATFCYTPSKMKNTTAPYSPFKLALLKQTRKVVRFAKTRGTTVMSVENLKTLTRPPGSSLQGAPLGINAPAMYSQMFRDVVAENADLFAFTNL